MTPLYLWVDLASFIPPLLLSFHPRLQFYKRWASLWPAILITAICFIFWDAYYTKIGVWGFNPKYLLGIYIGNLPIEEILFFICIPYACIYSYHCFEVLLKKNYFKNYQRKISLVILLFSIVLSIIYYDKLYTNVAFGLLVLVLLTLEFIFKVSWLSRFYFAYLFLQIPFFIVNGILTGTGIAEPIVWYNPNEFIGIRLLSIPFEDTFYGMSMLLCSIGIYELFRTRKTKN
jgi:lycopene cyclase domain-containing protein